MTSTTFHYETPTLHFNGQKTPVRCPDELLLRYQEIIDHKRICWTEHHHMLRLLGSGGQGEVYLSQRRGADNFTLPIALKVFSPERYEDERSYDPNTKGRTRDEKTIRRILTDRRSEWDSPQES